MHGNAPDCWWLARRERNPAACFTGCVNFRACGGSPLANVANSDRQWSTDRACVSDATRLAVQKFSCRLLGNQSEEPNTNRAEAEKFNRKAWHE